MLEDKEEVVPVSPQVIPSSCSAARFETALASERVPREQCSLVSAY